MTWRRALVALNFLATMMLAHFMTLASLVPSTSDPSSLRSRAAHESMSLSFSVPTPTTAASQSPPLPPPLPPIPTATAQSTSRAVPAPAPSATPAPAPSLVTPEQFAAWSRVAQCEEGGNWHANGSLYSGGLGISRTNWVAYGGLQFAPEGAAATAEQQIVVAMRINGQYVPDQNGVCAAW